MARRGDGQRRSAEQEQERQERGGQGQGVDEGLLAPGQVAEEGLAWEDEPALHETEIAAQRRHLRADGVAQGCLDEVETVGAHALGDGEIVGEDWFEAGESAHLVEHGAAEGVEHAVDRDWFV